LFAWKSIDFGLVSQVVRIFVGDLLDEDYTK